MRKSYKNFGSVEILRRRPSEHPIVKRTLTIEKNSNLDLLWIIVVAVIEGHCHGKSWCRHGDIRHVGE